MREFEYFQETAGNIVGDSWTKMLKKHGDQGWELCSVNPLNTYKKQNNKGSEDKIPRDDDQMQTTYIATFKREI